MDLAQWVHTAAQGFEPGVIAPDSEGDVVAYMIERFRAWYEDENIAPEVFRSVAALGLTQPLDIQHRVHAVARFTQMSEASSLAAANKRVSNILAKRMVHDGP